MNKNYVTYHLHSALSLLDSCTSYKDYILRAKELGQKAIAFTEHGNIYNWIEKKLYCEGTQYKVDGKFFDDKKKMQAYVGDSTDKEIIELGPIKYIHGVEIYLTAQLEPKVRDNYHTILLAKNYSGLQELNTLIDISTQPDHFYYKPRISFDEFFSISDNIIKISACIVSPLRAYPQSEEADRAIYERLLNTYDYYEVQPHIKMLEQIDYNKALAVASKQYNKPLIAGTDTHSINNYKAECRDILKKAKNMDYSGEDDCDLTYKSYNELVEMFRNQGALTQDEYITAIDNTNIMADSVESFELDKEFKYPKLYDDEEEALKKLINRKYKEKVTAGIIKPNPQYAINVREEMRVFKKIGMIGFMLFMSELVSWCWDNDIPVGFCRGSVGGSTIAYLTDIIDVDPIIWNTVFSRFANEDRKEIGDIDIDISPSQRQLVYEHIIESFGTDYTAYVLAINTISDKGTIDEIGRALAKNWEESHPNSPKEDNPYTLKIIADIKKKYDVAPDIAREEYSELFYYFDGLVDTPISQSMHPAGIIVSPVTLPNNYGTFWSDGKRILNINMEEVHEVSLVKYDLLGLKNVEIIKDTCELAGIKYPKSHTMDWNDQDAWAHITDSPVGIFQFESSFAFDCLKKFGCHKINDLSLVNASLRPSGESYRARLLAHEKESNPSPIIDELLADNNGFLCFQEDTIKFLTNICGLSGSDADNVRRAIGRKQIDRLQEALPDILEGYCSKSDQPREVAEKEAKQFLQIIEDSSNYQFGFNHSTGYSMIGYVCGYLRYYYSVEFVTAYLNNASNDEDINNGTALAMQLGIKIEPIRFRHSLARYSCNAETKTIYKGIASIKYMNEAVATELYQLRNNKYQSFVHLLQDINKTSTDSRQLDILVKLDFFSEFGEPNDLLKQIEVFNKLYGKVQLKKDVLEMYGVEPAEIAPYCETETAKMFKNYSIDAIAYICNAVPKPKTTLLNKVKWEQDLYGYVTLSVPSANKRDYFVVKIESKNKLTILSLHELFSGTTRELKIWTKQFSSNPFEEGNILRISTIDKKHKQEFSGEYKEDGKRIYRDIPDQFEFWLKSYSVLENI